ncbi:MAG: AbrB family transcriptional regulator [Pseudomonadota bacterium]
MKLPDPWPDRLSKKSLAGITLGLAVGAIGGAIAAWAHVPLAWMLGALFFTMAASLAGAPVAVPTWLRMYFITLLGLFLGESFDQISIDDLARWPITLTGAILYCPIGGGIAYLFYRYVAREERNTAICEAIPGGLSAVVLIANSMGADERSVALSQSLRISIVILLAPLIAFGMLGLPAPEADHTSGKLIISLADFSVLLAVSMAMILGLAQLGMPLPALVAPILASAVLRMAGVVEGALPHWLIEVSLVVLGSSIGSRFAGVAIRKWLAVAGVTLIGTIILMGVSFVFAIVMTWLTGIELFPLLLAYAPGGVAEMSLIALAIDADPGFVAVHHVVRITFILLTLPLFAAWLMRRRAARAGG